MNKFPNTDSIFTVIGNEPVLDQFDVSYSALLSGSTVDNYITGSLISKKFGFSFAGPEASTLVFGERGLVFSKTSVPSSGDAAFPGGIPTSTSTSYNSQPWKERSGIIRNLRIFSQSERFYDSLTPRINELVEVLGGKVALLSPEGIIYIGKPSSPLAGHTFGLIESFPFETKFSKVKRVRNPTTQLIATIQYGPGTPITPTQVNTLTILVSDLSNFTYWRDVPASGIGLLSTDISKVIFGFGDVRTGVGNNRISFRVEAVSDVAGPILRGWKYGLVSGNAQYTSCVFRRDKFGQFRDMLEQRPSSAFISDENNSPINFIGGVEKPAMPPVTNTKNKTERIAYPVEVAFVKQDIVANKLVYTTQEPDNTWSSNLSTYATSSLPFFDDDLNGTNRDATSFGKITSGITLNVARDFFGNLSIG